MFTAKIKDSTFNCPMAQLLSKSLFCINQAHSLITLANKQLKINLDEIEENTELGSGEG